MKLKTLPNITKYDISISINIEGFQIKTINTDNTFNITPIIKFKATLNYLDHISSHILMDIIFKFSFILYILIMECNFSKIKQIIHNYQQQLSTSTFSFFLFYFSITALMSLSYYTSLLIITD
jgi:hypothetical protein